MAKTFLMGEGKLTDEERQQMEVQKHIREEQDKKWLEEQKQREKDKKEVTLSELLETTLVPQEDRIIVWRDKADRFTDGGLLKPDEVLEKERPCRGTVIAAGPGKNNENLTQELLLAIFRDSGGDEKAVTEFEKRTTTVTASYKPGDRIMFGRFAGTPIDDPKTGEELLIMRPSDIFVKL